MSTEFFPTKLPLNDTPSQRWSWGQELDIWMRGESWPTTTQTASFTVDLNFIFPCDATAGNIVATLPLANTKVSKKYLFVKVDSSAHTVAVTPAGSDTVIGAASFTLTKQWDALWIASDGVSSWYILSFVPAGGGSSVSITATTPIVVTPSPITGTGVITHATSGVTAGTYGDSTHFPVITVDNKGHVTAASQDAVPAGGVTSITATAPITVTPSPITSTGDIEHANSGVSAASYGDSTHFTNFTVNVTGHVTAASSVAIPTSGTLQSQAFTSNGTFNVPAGVTLVWARLQGAGGGGSNSISANTGGGGGGCGEEVENLSVPCTSSGTISVTIGTKGNGGATGQGSAQVGADGGDTSITSNSITYFARGGKGGANTGAGGKGGGFRGGAGGGTGTPGGTGSVGTQESPVYFGGAGGAGGGSTITANGGPGTPNAGYPTGSTAGSAASSQAGGGGGASSPFGIGGAGGNGGVAGSNAPSTSYGSGGGGAGGHATTTLAGGNGCDGYVVIQWVA